MAQHGRLAAAIMALAALAGGLAGCGDDDIDLGGATPTATATRTATTAPTATRTPTVQAVAQVAGLIVVAREVGSGENDGLKQLPPESLPPVGRGFDRSLGNADWSVGDGTLHGTTTDDGRFSITGLSPGRHIVRVTKTVDGNLLELAVPIIVGDDGAAEVVAEVSWGLVRSTSTYTQGGAAHRAVFAPNGAHLVARGVQLIEFGDGSRTLVDSDGDGRFDPQSGGCTALYSCDASGGCGDPETVCVCLPSCPGCADCPQRACVARNYFHTPECGPDGLCKPFPYSCSDGGG
ncbi:MAG: carboxypeptidase-like regulatory domain-containing protein, partial [Candidatus Binatia bacterium]